MADIETVSVTEQTSEGTETTPAGEEASTSPAPEGTEANADAQTSADADGATPTATDGGTPTAETTTSDIVFMPVYNGQAIPIGADQTEEITTLLQMGMKYRDTAEQREKLHQLAACFGLKSIDEFVEVSIRERDKAQLDELVREHGQEAGKLLFEAHKAAREKQFGTFKDADAKRDAEAKAAVEQRLAEQFVEMQTMHPDYTSIKDVPAAVIREATSKGISLLDAMNRYVIQNQRAADAAKHKQQQNAQVTTGSVADLAGGGSDPVLAAWRAGVRGRRI